MQNDAKYYNDCYSLTANRMPSEPKLPVAGESITCGWAKESGGGAMVYKKTSRCSIGRNLNTRLVLVGPLYCGGTAWAAKAPGGVYGAFAVRRSFVSDAR